MKPVRLQRTLIAAALGVGMCITGAVTAQVDSTVANVPVWVEQLGAQLGESLESPSQTVRHSALQHITYFAYFYGDDLDLTNAVPTLLRTFKEDDDERCQLMALAALHAIGNADAMQEVRSHVMRQESPQVQLVTLAALMEHYGEATFEGDERVADLAKKLFEYYTSPRVIVAPPFDVHEVPQ
ncbi:MAG: HEAT repeat domain-containing protein [Rhodothermia bacterium]|nr:HEAT repeat domain-containing protein [Rhodothermia bacterium]NNE36264.1 hypothetical protein [Rhodothermales bacterium]